MYWTWFNFKPVYIRPVTLKTFFLHQSWLEKISFSVQRLNELEQMRPNCFFQMFIDCNSACCHLENITCTFPQLGFAFSYGFITVLEVMGLFLFWKFYFKCQGSKQCFATAFCFQQSCKTLSNFYLFFFPFILTNLFSLVKLLAILSSFFGFILLS